jgi:DedD protein
MEIDDKLKNRLAGAAVITVLAVIFLPMLFDDPVEKKGQVVSELDIPHKPQVSSLLTTAIVPDKNNKVISTPKPAVADAGAGLSEDLADSSEKSATNPDSEKLSLDTDTEPAALDEENPTPAKKKAHKKATVATTHIDKPVPEADKKKTYKKETVVAIHSD